MRANPRQLPVNGLCRKAALIRPWAGPRAPSPEGGRPSVSKTFRCETDSPDTGGGGACARGARELTRSLCPLYYKGASAPRGTARRERPPACGGSRSAGTGSGSVPRRFRRQQRRKAQRAAFNRVLNAVKVVLQLQRFAAALRLFRDLGVLGIVVDVKGDG